MRRFLAVAFALALAALPARADFGAGGQLQGFWVGGSPPTASVVGTAHAEGNTVQTVSYTFSSVAIGTASDDRHIIVILFTSPDDNSPAAYTTTVAGQSTTRVANADTTVGLGVYITDAPVTTGTTATIVVTVGEQVNRANIAVFAATGLGSTTPTGTWSDTSAPFSQSTSVNARGFIVGGGWNNSAVTWGGITEFSDETWLKSASDNFATASTPTVTVSGGGAMVVAAWGP